MFCHHCGTQLDNQAPAAGFCTNCGTRATPIATVPPAGHEQVMRFRFWGDGATLFGISLQVFLLTIVTLGIYSFWGVVKKRRYMYSQTDLDSQRFSFDGTGKELFFGWLKAVALLMVLALQVVLMEFTLGDPVGVVVGNGIWTIGLALLVPLIITGAWRYRMSRSSYRGLRFSFRGRVSECYAVYFVGLILSVLTLGIYVPFFLTNLRRFLVSNSKWGSLRFQFDGDGWNLLKPWIFSLLLAIPTLGLSMLWFEGRKQIYYWQRTKFEGARFETDMTPMGYLGTWLIASVLTFVTLGIASPWATVIKATYVADNLRIRGIFDLTSIYQQAMSADPVGEELAGILDVEAAGFEL